MVTTLVDVRSTPYSQYNPQFNKEQLEHHILQEGVQYIHAGKNLGGRPTDPTCYKSRKLPGKEETDYLHEVDYDEVAKREWFKRGINWLLRLAEESTLVIMCSEENPAACHRHHLIAKYLLDEYFDTVQVRHIRGDGVVYGATSVLESVNEPQAEQMTLFQSGEKMVIYTIGFVGKMSRIFLNFSNCMGSRS